MYLHYIFESVKYYFPLQRSRLLIGKKQLVEQHDKEMNGGGLQLRFRFFRWMMEQAVCVEGQGTLVFNEREINMLWGFQFSFQLIICQKFLLLDTQIWVLWNQHPAQEQISVSWFNLS